MIRISYSEKDHIEKLVARYEAIYKNKPGTKIYAPLADAYRKQGRLDDAIKIAITGLKIDPNYFSARLVLGKCFYDKGFFEKAITEFKIVLDVNPQNIMGRTYLAKSYLGLSQYEESLKHFLIAKEMAPHNINNLDKIVEKLKAKIDPLAKSMLAPKGQEAFNALSKKNVFESEKDQFVVRDMREIESVKGLEAQKEKISTTGENVSTLKSIKELYLTLGLEKRALEIVPENTSFTPQKISSEYISNSEKKVLKATNKEFFKRYNIGPVLNETMDAIPSSIIAKNKFDEEYENTFDAYINQNTIVEDEVPPTEEIEKNFDGIAPKNYIMSTITSKQNKIKLLADRLHGILGKIEERAY